MITIVMCVKELDDSILENFVDIRAVMKSECKYIIVTSKVPKNLFIYKKIKIIIDDGSGLGNARKLALKYCDTKYICYVGDDNLIQDCSIERAIDYMNERNWVGVALQTRVYGNLYLAKSMNMRWVKRFTEGKKKPS